MIKLGTGSLIYETGHPFLSLPLPNVVQCAYHVFVIYLGKVVDSVHCIAGRSNANMSWIFLEIPPGNLEICSVKFVDTLKEQIDRWTSCLLRMFC